MSNTSEHEDVWAVIVTVDSTAQAMPVLVAHARYGISRFPSFPGFISGVLQVSRDGTRLVQSLRWRSEAEYLACRDDPVWDSEPTAGAFMAVVHAGDAKVDERAFTIVATS